MATSILFTGSNQGANRSFHGPSLRANNVYFQGDAYIDTLSATTFTGPFLAGNYVWTGTHTFDALTTFNRQLAVDTTQGDLDITGTGGVVVDVASSSLTSTGADVNVRTQGASAGANTVTMTGATRVELDANGGTDVQVGSSGPLTVTAGGANGDVSIDSTGTVTVTATGGNIELSAGTTIDMNGNEMTNVAAPSGTSDLATKTYVDSNAAQLSHKNSVKVASTGNVALSGGAALSIDGIALANDDRVLLKNQGAGAENGIYTVSGIGTAYSLTRATDMDEGDEFASASVFVEQGTTNADTGWVCTNNGTITVDTTPVTWAQSSYAGILSAGTGIQQVDPNVALDDTANFAWTGTHSHAANTLTINDSASITGGALIFDSSILYGSLYRHGPTPSTDFFTNFGMGQYTRPNDTWTTIIFSECNFNRAVVFDITMCAVEHSTVNRRARTKQVQYTVVSDGTLIQLAGPNVEIDEVINGGAADVQAIIGGTTLLVQIKGVAAETWDIMVATKSTEYNS